MFARIECRQIDRLLWDYAAMALCEPEMEKVEAHISRCRACARKSEAYASVVGVVKTGRMMRMPESGATWHSLRVTLERERRDVPALRRTRNIPALALGSAVMAAFLIFVFAPRLANDEGPVRPIGDDQEGQKLANSFGVGPPAVKRPKDNIKTPALSAPIRNVLAQDPPQRVKRQPNSSQDQPVASPNVEYGTSPEPRPSIQTAGYQPGNDADRPLDRSQQKDYVLTPVRMGSSQSGGAHFVMGTIPQSEGGITTASYTKAAEEPPVW